MSSNDNTKSFSKEINDISSNIQTQLQTQGQMQASLLDLQKMIFDFKSEISNLSLISRNQMDDFDRDIKALTNSLLPNVRDLDSIPGVRTPKWYQVVINFDINDDSEKFSTIDINPEGPFVVKQITPLWFVGNGNNVSGNNKPEYFANGLGGGDIVPSGRILPCSAYPLILKTLGYTNSVSTGYGIPSMPQLFYRDTYIGNTTSWGPLSDIPELFFQIEITGTGKMWTNQPISAAAFYGYFGRPLDVGVLGWIDRGDRLTIKAIPSVAVPHVGKVLFILHGYQILGDVNISKELGY